MTNPRNRTTGTGTYNRSGFRVLIVDDEKLYAAAISKKLRIHKIASDMAHTAAEAINLASTEQYQVVLLDHRLPDDDGIRIIPSILSRQNYASVVMMTAYETIPNAIAAIRQGAEDYLVKETSLGPIIGRILEIKRRKSLHKKESEEPERSGLLGESKEIKRVVEQVRKVAFSPETTVLITGETGVGKEVTARFLHRVSTRPKAPFVVVDCVAQPANLLESFLFGHEKGAFTGADRQKDGAFHVAGNGTILFDEIGEMDISLQGKLLRVLESRHFQRVGSVKEFQVEARVIAATNRDLMELVRAGKFRFDLYQRLAIFPIHLPPLRLRGSDTRLLADHFVKIYSQKINMHKKVLTDEVYEKLMGYAFPGNVRELRNVIERAVIIAESETVDIEHLPDRILRNDSDIEDIENRSTSVPVDFIPGVDTLETFEQKTISYALKQTGGVKTKAAQLLGISRFQLLRRMEKYGLKTSKDDVDKAGPDK